MDRQPHRQGRRLRAHHQPYRRTRRRRAGRLALLARRTCADRFARQSGDFGHRRRRAVVDRRRHNAQENPINLNHSIMDTLKTDKTDTAEAENIETMELLTGMLDNATQCGGTDDENPEPEKSGK